MNPTIRNRAAALGIAAVAGAATVSLASGPALASTSSDKMNAAPEPRSTTFPTNPVDYADDFVSAYGVGDQASVDDFATETTVTSLYQHDHPHADKWNRTFTQSEAGTTYVTYQNLETNGRLTVSVRNETAAHGDGDAVHSIEFVGQEGEYSS